MANEVTQIQNNDDTLNIHMFKAAVPLKVRDRVTQKDIDDFNTSLNPEELKIIKDNAINYSSILKNPHYTVRDYLDAVKYVSFVLTGDSHIDAYKKTFPQRMQDFTDKEYSSKRISQHVSMYHKGQLITNLLDYASVPTHILNAPILQGAINILWNIANDDSVCSRDRVSAARGLVEQLKKPESIKQKDIEEAVSNNSTINVLEQALNSYSKNSLTSIKDGGLTVEEITSKKLPFNINKVPQNGNE